MPDQVNTTVRTFFVDLRQMENAEVEQRRTCWAIVDRVDLPKSRTELQRAMESVYRKGFYAGAKQFAQWQNSLPPIPQPVPKATEADEVPADRWRGSLLQRIRQAVLRWLVRTRKRTRVQAAVQ